MKIKEKNPHNSQNRGGNNFKKKNRFGDNNHKNREDKSKGIQCRECERFVHNQAECANTLKKNKSYVANWSDEDSDGGSRMTIPLTT